MEARYVKTFKLLEEQLMNLGYGRAKAKLVSQDSAGNLIGYMNFSDATASTGDQMFFVRFKPWHEDPVARCG
jgi:hypothetical protein